MEMSSTAVDGEVSFLLRYYHQFVSFFLRNEVGLDQTGEQGGFHFIFYSFLVSHIAQGELRRKAWLRKIVCFREILLAI